MYKIQIANAAGETLQLAEGQSDARLYYQPAYEKGDKIIFTADTQHVYIKIDQTLPESLVFLKNRELTYNIPFDQEALAYAPQSFAGAQHILTIRPAQAEDLYARRNLAFNPIDQRFYEDCYPHAKANVETRNESVFYARNVIDGLKFNHSHGGWPFQSWGIGGRADAEMTLYFGRLVSIDEVAFTLRADFPHDNWWTAAQLTLSDGHNQELSFQKTGETQAFALGEHQVEWMRISHLVKADEPSEFPALTQWEIFGRDLA